MKVAARLAVSQHAPAAVLFLAPALAFTFPLLLNMTTMLLGAPGDNMFWLGLLGWYAKSCGIGFAGMLNDTQLFYPLGVNLLPYAFLITLPLFSAARSVAGFGIVPLVCVSLLSSMGLDDWLRRVAGARISVRRRQMLAFFLIGRFWSSTAVRIVSQTHSSSAAVHMFGFHIKRVAMPFLSTDNRRRCASSVPRADLGKGNGLGICQHPFEGVI